MFHGTDHPIEEFDLDQGNPSNGGRFDLCTTDDDGIAEVFATRFHSPYSVPTIVELEISDDAKIAIEDEVLDILDIDPESISHPSQITDAVDDSRQRFVDAGYDAITFRDCLPGTTEVFECVRIYSRDAVEIVDSWEAE